MNRSAEGGEAGFSLLEMLIALVLFTVGVAAMTTGFSEGHQLAGEVGLRQRAISLAQDKLAEKLTMTIDAITTPTRTHERVEGGVLVGQEQIGGIVRTWLVEPDQPAQGLVRVWVATSWVRGGTRKTYQVGGLLAEGVTP